MGHNHDLYALSMAGMKSSIAIAPMSRHCDFYKIKHRYGDPVWMDCVKRAE